MIPNQKSIVPRATLFLLLFFLTACAPQVLEIEAAIKKLESFINTIDYREDLVNSISMISMDAAPTLADNLPDIEKFGLTVDPETDSGDVTVEIFTSTEKSSPQDPDNWMIEVATEFNRRNVRLASGKTAKIKVRRIASGDGYCNGNGRAGPAGFPAAMLCMDETPGGALRELPPKPAEVAAPSA